MTARTLVLVRHGRTAWNLEGRMQGHTDVPLDEVGELQAKDAARRLTVWEPVRLWSSDLLRARRTAEVIGEAVELAPVFDARLRERDVGERSGLTMPEFRSRFPREYDAFTAGLSSPRVPGEEDPVDVRRRVAAALREALAALAPGETGMVVGHGAALRSGIADLLGWPAGLEQSLTGLDNAASAVLRQRPGAPVRLASYNLW